MVWPVIKRTLFPISRLFIRHHTGLEHLPKPPFILAANHESYLDPFLILSLVVPKINKKIHYIVMKGRFWDFFGDRLSREWAACVPVDEGKKKAVKELEKVLKKGSCVGIFPGGARSLDGNLTKGKTGAVRLALNANVPIVPVGIIGAYEIAPKNQLIPKLKRCELKFGKPIYLKKPKKITHALLRKHTTTLMKTIAKLIGKKYKPNESKKN